MLFCWHSFKVATLPIPDLVGLRFSLEWRCMLFGFFKVSLSHPQVGRLVRKLVSLRWLIKFSIRFRICAIDTLSWQRGFAFLAFTCIAAEFIVPFLKPVDTFYTLTRVLLALRLRDGSCFRKILKRSGSRFDLLMLCSGEEITMPFSCPLQLCRCSMLWSMNFDNSTSLSLKHRTEASTAGAL